MTTESPSPDFTSEERSAKAGNRLAELLNGLLSRHKSIPKDAYDRVFAQWYDEIGMKPADKSITGTDAPSVQTPSEPDVEFGT